MVPGSTRRAQLPWGFPSQHQDFHVWFCPCNQGSTLEKHTGFQKVGWSDLRAAGHQRGCSVPERESMHLGFRFSTFSPKLPTLRPWGYQGFPECGAGSGTQGHVSTTAAPHPCLSYQERHWGPPGLPQSLPGRPRPGEGALLVLPVWKRSQLCSLSLPLTSERPFPPG